MRTKERQGLTRYPRPSPTQPLTSVMPNVNFVLFLQVLSPQRSAAVSAPAYCFFSAPPSAQNVRLHGGLFWGHIIVFVSFCFSHYLM